MFAVGNDNIQYFPCQHQVHKRSLVRDVHFCIFQLHETRPREIRVVGVVGTPLTATITSRSRSSSIRPFRRREQRRTSSFSITCSGRGWDGRIAPAWEGRGRRVKAPSSILEKEMKEEGRGGPPPLRLSLLRTYRRTHVKSGGDASEEEGRKEGRRKRSRE